MAGRMSCINSVFYRSLSSIYGMTGKYSDWISTPDSGIFHPSIAIYLDKTASSTPTKTDLRALLTVAEMSRFVLKTGTDLGSTEGTGYINGTYRNVFGGAESLNASASIGTRTRSAFDVNFQAPIMANPDIIAEAGGYASSRSHLHFASYEEGLKGGRLGVRWRSKGDVHEAGFAGVWRQVTGLSESASASVRQDAGDTVKNALNYTFTRDRRDNALLPRCGYLYKHSSELAGWAGLGGDVAFGRTEIEAQGATTIPGTDISVTAGLRGGLLYPLSLGLGDAKAAPRPSRINDRFHLGGPTDVRGFRERQLGAKDGEDSVGGDAYLAGGASIFFLLPKVGAGKPLRIQGFVNGGRLLGLQGIEGTEKGSDVNGSVANALRMMTGQLPSIAAGVGIVYAHPVARFELNFCLPIVTRHGEGARKGLQVGVGMNFL